MSAIALFAHLLCVFVGFAGAVEEFFRHTA
jgi:hypothetical protein